MDTNHIIRALTADAHRRGPLPSSVWWAAALLAIALAAIVFFATLGPRPDFATAVATPRYAFKVLVMIALTISAFGASRAMSWPEETVWKKVPYLIVAPLLLVIGVIVELFVLPPEAWWGSLIGRNSTLCLTFILLMGIAPLAVFVLALRYGAPSQPAIAGAIAGMLAGGIAATFYAVHCPDDSPLFVATWYTIAIAGLAFIGAVSAKRFVRW